MNDATFTAEITGYKGTAKADEDKTIRRVEFKLAREFSIEVAEWIGPIAVKQREMLVGLNLTSLAIPIDAYHCKLTLSGLGGNVEVQASGVKVAAKAKETKAGWREDVVLTFDAFPEAKLLTFLASHLKEHVECTFQASQLEMAEAAT